MIKGLCQCTKQPLWKDYATIPESKNYIFALLAIYKYEFTPETGGSFPYKIDGALYTIEEFNAHFRVFK